MGEEGYEAPPPRRPGAFRPRAYDGFVPATKPKKPAGKAPKDATKPGTELFLIDGNSLAYRAFFALPEDIATSDGRPTNAIYGFASMMVKILVEHQPTAVVVVWDAGMSGREVVYEPYKAQRKPRPDLLKEQWPHIPKVAEAFGFTNVRVEGYEADDVIATLARQRAARRHPGDGRLRRPRRLPARRRRDPRDDDLARDHRHAHLRPRRRRRALRRRRPSWCPT